MVPKPPVPPKVPVPSVQDGAKVYDPNDPINNASLTPIQPGGPDPNQLAPYTGTSGIGNPSGFNDIKDTNGREQIKTGRPLPNLRPMVDVANYLTNLNSINKVRGVQLARKNMYQATPSLSVRPIQDLSPEILAAQQDARTQIRSTYAGSDPVMNTINKNMATAERDKVRTDQIAGRSQLLMSERQRFDSENRTNQQAAAETAATNLNRAQDFADYKTGVNTAALEAKKKLNSDFLTGIGANLDTAAQYNLTREGVSEQNRRQYYEDSVKWAYAAPTEGEKQKRLAKLDHDFPNGYTAHLIPKFRDAQAGGLDSTFLGKLFTRGDYNKLPSESDY